MSEQNINEDKKKRAEALAIKILKYSRNELMVALRFMDLALCKLQYDAANIDTVATDGKCLYFNPKHIFQLYTQGNTELNHVYIHMVLHCVFYHFFVNKDIENPRLWDLVCDIAVEAIINELNLKQVSVPNSLIIDQEILRLKTKYGKLTAEKLYRKMQTNKLQFSEIKRLKSIFSYDNHLLWYLENESSDKQDNGSNDVNLTKDDKIYTTKPEKNTLINDVLEEWQSISERIKVDIETASKEWGDRSESLCQNISEVNREKYDYSEFLNKFAVMGEEMIINDDEFDYIFYTYGLQIYKNVPLIEPLEYKDVKKIKEFVIAIDTSGSVEGELVKSFITKTYNILSQQNNFFTKINVHVIQCDSEIQMDNKITSNDEFENLIKNIELRGFGGTDFRPIFNYVDDLIAKGEFENLKGLIYFTDGYGTFPSSKPSYDTAFVFIDDDYEHPQIPVWAIKLVLSKNDI